MPSVQDKATQRSQLGKARRALLANPHDAAVEPSRLPVTVQRVLVGIFVIAVVVTAVFLLMDRWRRGTFAMGSALIYLGMIRWVVDSRVLGVLAVRSRKFDFWFVILVGTATVFLAFSVDPLI